MSCSASSAPTIRISTVCDALLARGDDHPVSVVIPTFNEEEFIVSTVRSLLALDYPTFEVIVVNDGSSDATLELLAREFELEPYPAAPKVSVPTTEVRGIYRSFTDQSFTVVDKVNGGKAEALNVGLNMSRYPLVFAGDAGSTYDPATLQLMVEPILRDGRAPSGWVWSRWSRTQSTAHDVSPEVLDKFRRTGGRYSRDRY